MTDRPRGSTAMRLAALNALRDDPNYRVIRRFEPQMSYVAPAELVQAIVAEGHQLKRAVVVDVETTGPNAKEDRITEIGAVVVEFSPLGCVLNVVDEASSLVDPGVPIPEKVQRLTGITDAMVKGCLLDEKAWGDRLNQDLIIAHGAHFDRKVIERYFPFTADRPWACSGKDVPWGDFDEGSGWKLEWLLFTRCQEFLDGAHRALDDARVALHLLGKPRMPDGRTSFAHLLDRARAKTPRIFAYKSRFESKDRLKAHGYHWSAEQKVWYLDTTQEELNDELAWLDATDPTTEPDIDSVSCYDRYSVRAD